MSSDGLRYVWVDSNKRLRVNAADIDPALITPTVKHGGGNIMVWSCMTWYGPGFLAKIDTALDAELQKVKSMFYDGVFIRGGNQVCPNNVI